MSLLYSMRVCGHPIYRTSLPETCSGNVCGMERHVAWRDMWHGETCGMERHVAWRDMWHGETCGLERHVAWRDMWHGEICGMERHVVWRGMQPSKGPVMTRSLSISIQALYSLSYQSIP